MRKALVITAAIAILGALSIFSKAQTVRPTTASANTPMQSTMASNPVSSGSNQASAAAATLKDGTYNGSAVDNPYGTVQVAAVISGGKITNIKFLQMPTDQRESMQRTMFSEPYLKDSAISRQSANIDFVSGATDTSQSFEQSLQAALNQSAHA